MQRLIHKSSSASKAFIVECDPPKLASIPLEVISAFCALSSLAVYWSQASLFSLPLLLLVAASLGTAVTWIASVQFESVKVLRGVGVVLETKRRSGLLQRSFFDNENIRSVIINEGVTTTDIRFYLAFVIQNSNHLAVAFPNLLPRLDVLRQVYTEVNALLAGREMLQPPKQSPKQ